MNNGQATSSLRVDLTGQTALVTGASQGLGLAMAQRLAGAGAKVACVARNADKLAAVVDSIRQAGGTAEALTCDDCGDPDRRPELSDPRPQVVDAAIQHF